MLLLAEWGRIASGNDLDRALAFNPYHAETRLALIAQLAGPEAGTEPSEGARPDPARAMALAAEGHAMHPDDARFASALGSLYLAAGDPARARQSFDEALALLPAEGTALTARFLFALEDASPIEAIEALTLLAFRHQGQLVVLRPAIGRLLSDPAARDLLIERLSDRQTVRERLLAMLVGDPASLGAAADLLLRWHAKGVASVSDRRHASRVASQLLERGDLAAAMTLDRLMLAQTGDVAGGFVTNGAFAHDPSGSPFDWSFPGIRGLSVTRVPAADPDRLQTERSRLVAPQEIAVAADEAASTAGSNADPVADAGPMALRLAFLDTPVQMRSPVQQLVLPAGTYHLAIIGRTAAGHSAPESAPVGLELSCHPSGPVLAALTLSDLPARWTERTAIFRIDDTQGCGRQVLSARNPFIAQSWQNRYTGAIELGLVRIQRQGNQP